MPLPRHLKERNHSPLHDSPLTRLVPLYKAFQRIKLRKAELIVDLGRVAVAVFGALPEFAAVDAPRKHGAVLLRLMAEDGEFFPLQVIWTDRHDAVDLMRLPFL